VAISDIVIYQLIMLWILGSIGIGFSFILPVSKNRTKARGLIYARLFLLLIVVAQTILSARLFDSLSWLLYAHPPTVLATAYMALLTVFSRFGEAISGNTKKACIVHLLGTSVVFGMMNVYDFSSEAYTALMVINSGLPILAATYKLRSSARNDSTADNMLFYILSVMSIVLLVIMPIYIAFGTRLAVHTTTFGFTVSMLFMLVFMLGFGSSVMFELVQKLNEQMTIDPLTKTKNRRFFDQVAPQYQSAVERRHTTVSFIACDIDHFKQVNDQHGHDVGDYALCHFASILSNEIRAHDALIRMGGEEFLIICPNLNASQAFQLADRLRKAVALDGFTHNGAKLILTASFGVATLTNDYVLKDIVKLADGALYKAKSLGRNRVVAATPDAKDS
jgi:diguanylate cyclase (GGDEF)-like protein